MKFLIKLLFLLELALIPILLIIASNKLVVNKSNGKHFNRISEIPKNHSDLAIVLGCSKLIGNYRNPFFDRRINATFALYQAGIITRILISAENSTKSYNESEDMMNALIEKGIPSCAITLDYAGFRTLDSMIRAKKVFGVKSCIIVSQKFHNERALFIASNIGLNAIAFNARDWTYRNGTSTTHLREYFARVKAFLDVYVLHTSPKFLGKEEKVNHC